MKIVSYDMEKDRMPGISSNNLRPQYGRKMFFSSFIIFILAVIPPCLGLYSFYRYEDFQILTDMLMHMPDFSWHSFTNAFQSQFWEYYRPMSKLIYWSAYLIAGNDPFVMHLLLCITYALNAVSIYIIGRFFYGELGGWLSAILWATLAPIVVISWWTGAGGNFPASLIFHIALILFLHTPAAPRLIVPISLFLFMCSFFYKESFIMLSPILAALCLLDKRFRTAPHFLIALIAPVLAGMKIWIASALIGSTLNKHVHLNLFEIPISIVWGNFQDYARLLVYGHNYAFVILGLLSVFIFVVKKEHTRALAMVGAFILMIVFRFTGQMALLDLSILLLTVFYFIICAPIEKIWLLWVGLGLAQVLFWDIRIAGSIMNRLLIQASFGFALFLGCSLTHHILFIKDTLRPYTARLKSIISRLYQISSFKKAYITIVLLFVLFGIREEYAVLGIKQIERELSTWVEQGEALEKVLFFMVENVSEDASLVVVGSPFSGMQIPEQVGHALVLFERADIEIFYAEQDSLSQILQDFDKGQSVFLTAVRPLNAESNTEQNQFLRLIYRSDYNKYDGYVYKLDFKGES